MINLLDILQLSDLESIPEEGTLRRNYLSLTVLSVSLSLVDARVISQQYHLQDDAYSSMMQTS